VELQHNLKLLEVRMAVKIQIRRGTAAEWTSANPTLLSGEQGLETDTGKTKIGDGVTAWNSLGYAFVPNSLVNAKGDLIGATADNTPAILTAGANGQMLMADSSATAGLRYVDPPTNRNLFINSAMNVHQRGTSSAGVTSGYLTADRWNTVGAGTPGTWTQSVETDAPAGTGFVKSLKMLCTTANASLDATDSLYVRQMLEGQDLQRIKKGTSAAEQLTASFWVKSNVTGTYVAWVFDFDNSRQVSATYSISSADTWERKTITFPADTTGALDNDDALSMWLAFYLVAGSNFASGTLQTTWASAVSANRAVGQVDVSAATNNYWQVTGVQLETGPVATPFEFEPFEATLRKCQRYYYRIAPGAVGGTLGIGQCASTTAAAVYVPFACTMRVRPTALEQSGTAANYRVSRADTNDQDLSAVPAYNNASLDSAIVTCTTAGNLVAGNSTLMYLASASAYLAWSAEL
jgi:hypothetical protein